MIKNFTIRHYNFDGSKLFWFPGIFFILLGALTVLAPRFVIAIIALSFLFVGVFFMFVAWKVIQMKRKFDDMFTNFQKNGLQIKGVQVVDCAEPEDEPKLSKNVILH